MRCVACDAPLTQKEISMKSPNTGEDYLLCIHCLVEAGLIHIAEENPMASDEEIVVDTSAELIFDEGDHE